jgi:hypothetical protein
MPGPALTGEAIFLGEDNPMLQNLQNLWGREPAMAMALVGAMVALLTSFGLALTATQVGAISALAAAILGWITRQSVTPVLKAGGK